MKTLHIITLTVKTSGEEGCVRETENKNLLLLF